MSKSINDIKKEFEAVNLEEVTQLIDLYKEDTRAGVVKLIQSYENKLAKLEEEKERIKLMKTFENDYLEYEYVCGIDEVGRGPLAGPVVAAVVVLPKDCEILYVNDSKQLSEKKREELYDIIIEEAVDYGVGIVYQNEIDEINKSGENEFKLGFSYGMTTITPDSNSDDFLNTMDSRMYEMKSTRKVIR